MKDTQDVEALFLVLIEFLMLSKRRVIELGAECGLTGLQTMMLFQLQTPRPMHSFKTMFNCDASNITGLVDGLEQKDLAFRYESEQDRRLKMVELTPKGKRVRSELVKKLTVSDSPILASLNADESRTFTELLGKLTDSYRHL